MKLISTEFSTLNPVLLKGEIGFKTNTGKIKVGNGVSKYINLKYFDFPYLFNSGFSKRISTIAGKRGHTPAPPSSIKYAKTFLSVDDWTQLFDVSPEGDFYRQVDFDATENKHFNNTYEDFFKFIQYHEKNKGKVITYPSCLSTTLIKSSCTSRTPYRGAFLICGKQGKIIDNYLISPNEFEALFLPKTPLIVNDFEWINNSKNIFATILSRV